MKNNPEEKEMNDFSWQLLFVVTGLCSFIFNGILVLLDGTGSSLFTWLGVSGTSIGIIIHIAEKLLKPVKK
jgi:hypothetical protein